MSLFNIFDVAGSALEAQSVRLNTTSSNLAHANSISSSTGSTYRARQPVFAPMLNELNDDGASVGVRVMGIVESPQFQMKELPVAQAKKNGQKQASLQK